MIATLLLISSLAAAPDLDALAAKAQAAAAKSDWKAAEKALGQLVKARPNDAGALYNHAAALSRLGKKDPAIKAKKPITVKAGQPFSIYLSENASTGFQWRAFSDKSFGAPKSTYTPPRGGGPIGSAGSRVLTWQTGSKFAEGKHTVTVEYARPFGNSKPAEKLTFTVNVVK